MTLRFDNPRHPSSRSDLTDAEVEQLIVLGERTDGEQRPAADWLAPEIGLAPELWDVRDNAGRVLYQVWLHHDQRGLVFRAGTTDVVGEIEESGFVARDREAGQALADADAPSDTTIARVDFGQRS